MVDAAVPLIAVVDDEDSLRSTVTLALRKEGWRTVEYADGRAAWSAFQRELPDLAVLDILMPRMDGLELCRRIRGVSERLPVIFLTSRDEEFDRVLGLELGADDYLCKPFSLRELAARIRVLFRRAALTAAPASAGEEAVTCGPLTLDVPRHEAAWGGEAVRLTVTEFRILESLARAPGVVKTRIELLHDAFPQDAYMSDRTVDAHVKRIRRKLERAAALADPIEAVYGLGYRLRPASA
jgi:DNA-binding response OmpR family regulator